MEKAEKPSLWLQHIGQRWCQGHDSASSLSRLDRRWVNNNSTVTLSLGSAFAEMLIDIELGKIALVDLEIVEFAVSSCPRQQGADTVNVGNGASSTNGSGDAQAAGKCKQVEDASSLRVFHQPAANVACIEVEPRVSGSVKVNEERELSVFADFDQRCGALSPKQVWARADLAGAGSNERAPRVFGNELCDVMKRRLPISSVANDRPRPIAVDGYAVDTFTIAIEQSIAADVRLKKLASFGKSRKDRRRKLVIRSSHVVRSVSATRLNLGLGVQFLCMAKAALWALEVFARIGRSAQSATDLVHGAADALAELSPSRATAVLLSVPREGPVALALVASHCSSVVLTTLRDQMVEHYRQVRESVRKQGEQTDDENDDSFEAELSVSIEGLIDSETSRSGFPDDTDSQQTAVDIDQPFNEVSFCLIRSSKNDQIIGLIGCADALEPSSSQKMAVLCAEQIANAAEILSAHPLESTLPHLVDSIADGLILADKGSDVVLINPAARSMLGLDPDRPFNQSYLKEKLGFYPFDLVNVSRGTNEPLREEVAIGNTVLHSVVSPVRDEIGTLVGVAVILRDYTEAKALAERQREFVSVVSHELRTPLTSIAGALDIVLSEYAGRLAEKQRRYLSLARDSCTRLNTIVDDLLDLLLMAVRQMHSADYGMDRFILCNTHGMLKRIDWSGMTAA